MDWSYTGNLPSFPRVLPFRIDNCNRNVSWFGQDASRRVQLRFSRRVDTGCNPEREPSVIQVTRGFPHCYKQPCKHRLAKFAGNGFQLYRRTGCTEMALWMAGTWQMALFRLLLPECINCCTGYQSLCTLNEVVIHRR